MRGRRPGASVLWALLLQVGRWAEGRNLWSQALGSNPDFSVC